MLVEDRLLKGTPLHWFFWHPSNNILLSICRRRKSGRLVVI
tara:strand:- start:968 stop:1090 length:123 start_codon:yes stop_codon:yes gene_type:complete